MTRHGADTVEDDYPDESNLQTFVFTSQPKCCKKCDCPEPLCHECCGKYQFERDMAIRKDEREKILDELEKWLYTKYETPLSISFGNVKAKIAELRQEKKK